MDDCNPYSVTPHFLNDFRNQGAGEMRQLRNHIMNAAPPRSVDFHSLLHILHDGTKIDHPVPLLRVHSGPDSICFKLDFDHYEWRRLKVLVTQSKQTPSE